MDRRSFLGASSASLAFPLLAQAGSADKLRVAVIGHTGRGNYGHGLDQVWLQIPETKIVAVADPDANGLADAKKRLKANLGFADYRAMVKEVQPDIVAVCPRHPDQHRDMIVAVVEKTCGCSVLTH